MSVVPSLIPVNNFESHLELRDNPVLQSGRPFWSNSNGSAFTEDDDDDEEGGEREKERRVEAGEPDDDSESDSSPSLLATIRAASLALNLPFSPPIALPGNETAFAQFASSVSLPSFDTFVPPEVSSGGDKYHKPGNTVAAVVCTPKDDDGDDDDDDGDDGSDIVTSSWIPDPTKLMFSENLFPPKFSPPRILRPPSVPILQDKVLSSFSAIAEAAPEKEGFPTNPVIHTPRQDNSQPLCQQSRLSLYERTQEMVTVSSQEEVTIDESLPGTRYLPIQCEVVPDLRLVSPVAKFVGPSTVDPPSVASQPSPPPVQIIDLPTPSSNEAVSSGSDCVVEIQDPASTVQPPIRLKLRLSDIRLRHKKVSRKRKVEQESLPQQQPLDVEAPSPPKTRKIGTILRFSRVGGTFRTETVVASQSSPNRTVSSPPQPTPQLPQTHTNATARAPAPPIQPIWAAAKPSRRGRRGTGGRGGRGRGGGSFRADRVATTATVSAVCCHVDENNGRSEASIGPQQSLSSTSANAVAPTLSKKFFSSSKEDRRSSAIRTVRGLILQLVLYEG